MVITRVVGRIGILRLLALIFRPEPAAHDRHLVEGQDDNLHYGDVHGAELEAHIDSRL